MKKNNRNKIIQKKEYFVDRLQFPKDLLLGDSIITLTGKHTLSIENYKGIMEYTSTQIQIQGKNGQICVQGKNLLIEYYTNDDMKISGCIKQIQYL